MNFTPLDIRVYFQAILRHADERELEIGPIR